MINFLKNILHPHVMQFRELSLQDIGKTLESRSIQEQWLKKMVLQIQMINMELDNLLVKSDKDRIWETLAIERRTLMHCLEMILEVRDEMESERIAQEAQNKLYERYQGASAPIGRQ